VSNVAKHSRATGADVHLAAGGGQAVLTVTDDGIGPGEATANGHGRVNMRARARDLGGTFDLAPGPAGGTVLTWRVPI
jgi:signal transduction histidine kinase